MQMQPQPEPQVPRPESPQARADRNLVELLQELRVVQAGVQIVFAFLLGVAFTNRFAQLNAFQRDTYVVTLLMTDVASAVLATPVALHRVLFHRGLKPRIVALSTRLAQTGLVFLALALNGAVLLLMDVVLGLVAAVATTAVTVAHTRAPDAAAAFVARRVKYLPDRGAGSPGYRRAPSPTRAVRFCQSLGGSHYRG
ncbi:DUF6328 family protein [Streptomyces sp. RB6PN25]|uniref:DUF6328 family protein n=1 Tax=Streptomyces humicola TaxID=2953240 RepID=A0ABT1PVT9_9ACTN|nr:DUF6328 family protein [Streptomyces humicola]MCQ4081759.1 DUF6328 family protein [Streptomyces humicola]